MKALQIDCDFNHRFSLKKKKFSKNLKIFNFKDPSLMWMDGKIKDLIPDLGQVGDWMDAGLCWVPLVV